MAKEQDKYKLIGQNYTLPKRFFRGKDGALAVVITCEKKIWGFRADQKNSQQSTVRFTLRRNPVGGSSIPSITYSNELDLNKFEEMVKHEITIETAEKLAKALDEEEKRTKENENKVYVNGVGMVTPEEAELFGKWISDGDC